VVKIDIENTGVKQRPKVRHSPERASGQNGKNEEKPRSGVFLFRFAH
jgi:hypothetical protein